LLNNRELRYSPVGFVDDDPAKTGKVIHGLRVFSGNGDLGMICKQHDVNEVLISSTRLTAERLSELVAFCQEHQISIRRMRITIEDLNGD